MGDAADDLTDTMIETIAMGGYCPDCDTVHDPEGPCRCDEDPYETGCVNDGRPVQPPSKVLCKTCLKDVGDRLEALVATYGMDSTNRGATAPQGEKMDEKNSLTQLMEGLLEQGNQIFIDYKGKMHRLDSAELPVKAGVRFMRGQLAALVEADGQE